MHANVILTLISAPPNRIRVGSRKIPPSMAENAQVPENLRVKKASDRGNGIISHLFQFVNRFCENIYNNKLLIYLKFVFYNVILSLLK